MLMLERFSSKLSDHFWPPRVKWVKETLLDTLVDVDLCIESSQCLYNDLYNDLSLVMIMLSEPWSCWARL